MPGVDDPRLLTLVGCCRGIVLEFDAHARYLNAWADDARLLARPSAQLIGKTINDVLGDEVGGPFTEMVLRVFATGAVEHLEYPLDLETGRRWFFADIKRVGDAGETGTSVVFFARDISERKATEEALARSEERYRLAARATNDVLWDWDIVLGTVTWNAVVCSVLGYTSLDNDVSWWKENIHPDDRAAVLDALDQALSGDASAWSSRYRFRRADGSYGDFLDRGFIARDSAGRAARMVGSMTDVSEIKRLQARLMQADRLAALGTLAAGLGHEINNPLSYVIGNLDVAIETVQEATNDDLLEPLREARDGARRIAEIVKSLRIFSRGDDNDKRAVDIHVALEAAIKIAEKEIRNRAQLSRDLEQVPPVFANEAQLAQVFLNLLINAAQAIGEGSPEGNDIRVATHVGEDARIIVTIEDTGMGIAPEQLSRIFDPFFTTKEVGTGTGLGLSICHGIVEKLGGEIAVASELGRGTVFTVSLPPAVATRTAVPRVLVIDDEIHIGRLVTRILKKTADVFTVTSARAGLARLVSSERFDLVLCDVMMPGMTGIELHDELRRVNPGLLRRVFFMTGGAFTPRAQEFLEGIGAARIDKPLDRSRLLSLLSTLH